MRLLLLSHGFILIGVLLIIVFNNYFQLGGLKINWMLMFLLILTLRHSKMFLPFVGILAGLIMDALSHGIMGLYGISFFITLLLVSQTNKLFYANSVFVVSLAVFTMSVFEGWLSLSILDIFEPDTDKSALMLISILPLAILQGILTPLIIQFVIFGENLFLGETA